MPWHCRKCGKVYIRSDHTRREVLNAWWIHMEKKHPKAYREAKEKAIRKMLRTKREKGLIR